MILIKAKWWYLPDQRNYLSLTFAKLTLSRYSRISSYVEKAKSYFYQVENGKRVIWIKSSKNSVNLLGILLESCQDCDYFMLLLDLCWKRRNKNKNLFLHGNMNLDLPEKPVLFSSVVKWTKFSCTVMEFLGRYLYHLKTPRKEIKSLEASNFYIK